MFCFLYNVLCPCETVNAIIGPINSGILYKVVHFYKAYRDFSGHLHKLDYIIFIFVAPGWGENAR